MPIILEILFLATYRALVDIEKEDPKFRLLYEEFIFNDRRTIKQPIDMRVVSVISYEVIFMRRCFGLS